MNEELKWLAENVHKWQRGSSIIKKDDYGSYVFLAGPDPELYAGSGFTRAQWQAARDEMSGKPNWDDAPGWAQWLAQDKDGEWWLYKVKPIPRDFAFGNDFMKRKVGFGKVLGDWRNTLEQRPDNHSVEPAENVWRGPEDGLPPVGTVCEGNMPSWRNGWTACRVVAHSNQSCAVVRKDVGADPALWSDLAWCDTFRPIRTEEDKAVDAMAALLGFPECHATKQICRRLYRAGYRKQEAE